MFFVLWPVPWKQAVGRASKFTTAIRQLSALLFFSWLLCRTQTAILVAIGTWRVFDGVRWAELLSYPLRNTLASIITASLTVIPLGRVIGRHSPPIAMLTTLYSATILTFPRVLTVSAWVAHPVPTAIGLYDASIFLLVMGEAAALLERRRIHGQVGASKQRANVHYSAFLAGRLNAVAALSLFIALACASVAIGFMTYDVGSDHVHHSPFSMATRSAAFPALLFVSALAAIASWRSIVRASARHAAFKILATVGRIAISTMCCALVLYGLFFGPVTANIFSQAVQSIVGSAWTISPGREPHVLQLRGELWYGISDSLSTALARDPSVQQLELSSPGGYTTEGLALARLVESRALSTVVRHECDSACTNVFVAGKERILVSGGKLGFHRTHSSSWDETPNEESNAEMARYYRAHGLREEFIERVLKVPDDALWYPSAKELLDAGVITRPPISETGQLAVNGQPEGSR